MKMQPALALIFVALSPAGLVLSSHSAANNVVTTAPDAAASTPDLAVDAKAADPDSWERIKDFPYEKRVDFIATLNRMSDKLGDRLREINAKATDLPYAVAQKREADTKAFDEARAYLKSLLSDLGTVTADTWVDAKGKVVEAWQRVQAAYDKTKSSPTA